MAARIKASVSIRKDHWEQARQLTKTNPLYRSIAHVVEVALGEYLERHAEFAKIPEAPVTPRQNLEKVIGPHAQIAT